jgi:hypothetical protein
MGSLIVDMAHPLNRKMWGSSEGFWVENTGDMVILKRCMPVRSFAGWPEMGAQANQWQPV